jgi:glycosyltransferase involved in cell wall biosynthesis
VDTNIILRNPSHSEKKTSLLISIEDLRAGGAQVFALRFAEYCRQKGHRVFLFHHYRWMQDKELVARISPGIEVLNQFGLPSFLDKLLFKIENLLNRNLFGTFQPRKIFLSFLLRKKIRKLGIAVVFSNTIKSDYVCARALKNSGLPFIITMHGDYEEFYDKIKKTPTVVHSFLQFISRVYNRIDGLIYLSERNLSTAGLLNNLPSYGIRKIYNGFQGIYKDSKTKREIRTSLNIPDEAVVFAMVSRGVEGKGWSELIEAFTILDNPDTWLVLIGGGEYLEAVKQKCVHSRIVFTGNHPNPIDLLKAFEIGILPSKFKESLPNSIVEYLYCGLPVIATGVGEVPAMLKDETGDEVGMTITFPDTEANYQQYKADLLAAMQHMLEPSKYTSYKNNIKKTIHRFEMENCYQEYFAFVRQFKKS